MILQISKSAEWFRMALTSCNWATMEFYRMDILVVSPQIRLGSESWLLARHPYRRAVGNFAHIFAL